MAEIIKRRSRSDIIMSEPLPQSILEYSADDAPEHYWVAYSAAFGFVPYATEPAILAPTAFTKTLQEQGNDIPILFNHDRTRPVAANGGNWVDSYGLRYRGIPYMEDEDSRIIYGKIKGKLITQGSIGFRAVQVVVDGPTKMPKITEAYLDHHAVLVKGASNRAKITEVYSSEGNEEEYTVEEWGALGFKNLPLAEDGTAWSAGEARKRLFEWAGGKDKFSAGKYSRAFLWVGEDTEKAGSYKFPVADLINGILTAIPRAIYAAAAVLAGARGGANIPNEDIPKLRSHLAKYYRKLEKETPWSAGIIIPTLDELMEYGVELYGESQLSVAAGPQHHSQSATNPYRTELINRMKCDLRDMQKLLER